MKMLKWIASLLVVGAGAALIWAWGQTDYLILLLLGASLCCFGLLGFFPKSTQTKKPSTSTASPSNTKALPVAQWRKSPKGNDTAEIDGFRVTIFKQDGEWNYCISEILDEIGMADGLEDDPQFGDGYPTKAAAQMAALAEL